MSVVRLQRALTRTRSGGVFETTWQQRAWIALLSFMIDLCKSPEPHPAFTTEQVRTWAAFRGLDPPPEPRAWGFVMWRAHHQGLVTSYGFHSSQRRSRKHAKVRVWRVA